MMQQRRFLPKIRHAGRLHLNDYLPLSAITGSIDTWENDTGMLDGIVPAVAMS